MTDGLKLIGLGGDLKKVLAEAEKLLAKDEIKTFIERVFPASDLSCLQEPDAMQDMVQQFTVVPEPPRSSQPARGGQQPKTTASTVLQALQADFRMFQTMTPEISDNGRIAVFLHRIGQRPAGACRKISESRRRLAVL